MSFRTNLRWLKRGVRRKLWRTALTNCIAALQFSEDFSSCLVRNDMMWKTYVISNELALA
jgi:hypothetical protein